MDRGIWAKAGEQWQQRQEALGHLPAWGKWAVAARAEWMESWRRGQWPQLGRGAAERAAQCLVYFMATMPISDLGEYGPEDVADTIWHSLWLREQCSWCVDLEEEFFLRHVLYYRIHTEGIEACRSHFYRELAPEVAGLGEREAAMAVNLWCARQASYAPADARTLSAMAVYRSGTGRCGEESVFVVSALRSVGLAARQVYAPWWRHCDDNHAWVEVWAEGAWHFLGACEPEADLDRGWFVGAAGRALLTHSRDFGLGPAPGEDCIGRLGCAYVYNQTFRYAKVATLSLTLGKEAAWVQLLAYNGGVLRPLAQQSLPPSGNMAWRLGLGPLWLRVWAGGRLAERYVELPEAGLELGWDEEWVYAGEEGWQSCVQAAAPEGAIHAPKPTPAQREQKKAWLAQARAAREEKAAREDACWDIGERLQWKKTFGIRSRGNGREAWAYISGDGHRWRLPMAHSLSDKDWKDLRRQDLEDFLSDRPAYRVHRPYSPSRLDPRIDREILRPYVGLLLGQAWLENLAPEDGHIESARRLWRALEERFGRLEGDVLRVEAHSGRTSRPEGEAGRGKECSGWLTELGGSGAEKYGKLSAEGGLPGAGEICNAGEMCGGFVAGKTGGLCRADVAGEHGGLSGWDHAGEAGRLPAGDGMGRPGADFGRICLWDYPLLAPSPAASLGLGLADSYARTLLFVAVCRSWGCAAMLSPRDGRPLFLADGVWTSVEEEGGEAVLRLDFGQGRKPVYGQDFAMERLEGEDWRIWESLGEPLPGVEAGQRRLWPEIWEEGESRGWDLTVPPGRYRIHLCLRLADGAMRILRREFSLAAGREMALSLAWPAVSREDMWQRRDLRGLLESLAADGALAGQSLPGAGEAFVLAFAAPGEEPTEHLFNEWRQDAAAWTGRSIVLIVEARHRGVVELEALQLILGPQLRLGMAEDMPALAEPISRAMYTPVGEWPYVVLVDGQGYGRYAGSGYNVGLAGLLGQWFA